MITYSNIIFTKATFITKLYIWQSNNKYTYYHLSIIFSYVTKCHHSDNFDGEMVIGQQYSTEFLKKMLHLGY